MFEGANGVKLSSVTDGASFTDLLGETEGSNIPWTEPVDIPVGAPTTLDGSGFSSFISGAVPFAFVDGSVKLLPNDIDPTILNDLFIRNDGAVLTDPSVSYVVSSVPEPGSAVLLIAGVLALFTSRRLALSGTVHYRVRVFARATRYSGSLPRTPRFVGLSAERSGRELAGACTRS